ncbi:MAG: CehA/McbA family metallohydrolase, partial [Armatimonadota bacterium]|nr:CehA/McbA family metallohydrolase [Armatimonadota bacterium]
GPATRGKPVDLTTGGLGDELRWVDAPYVAPRQPEGVDAWRQGTVVNESVSLVQQTEERLVIRAQGCYTNNRALSVVTDFTLEPGKPWVLLESLFANHGPSAMEVWVGDVLRVGDEGSVGVAWGAGRSADNMVPRSLNGSLPWMAHAVQGEQVVGVDYIYPLPRLSFYGGAQWVLSRLPLTLAPGSSFVLRRYLLCRPAAAYPFAPELAIAEAHQRLTTSLTGVEVAMLPSVTTLRVNEETTVRVRAWNRGHHSVGPVRLRLAHAYRLAVAGTTEARFPSLEPGAVAEASFRVTGEAVGRARLSAEAVTPGGTVTTLPTAFFVDGPGWYQGDCHSHTVHSDGKGSVYDNVAAALRLGLSFLFVTDHNTLTQAAEVAEARQPGFLCVAGEEITSAVGHANALFNTRLVPWRGSPQGAIASVRQQGGIYLINHPYLEGHPWRDWEVRDYHGIEVWN